MPYRILLTSYLLFTPLAHADMDPDFFKPGATWAEKQQNRSHDSAEISNKGYQGSPVYDKHGKLVVFSGPEVSHEEAEDYAKQYNETH